MAKDLLRSGCWKYYLHYENALCKVERNILRIKYIESCKRADKTPLVANVPIGRPRLKEKKKKKEDSSLGRTSETNSEGPGFKPLKQK